MEDVSRISSRTRARTVLADHRAEQPLTRSEKSPASADHRARQAPRRPRTPVKRDSSVRKDAMKTPGWGGGGGERGGRGGGGGTLAPVELATIVGVEDEAQVERVYHVQCAHAF